MILKNVYFCCVNSFFNFCEKKNEDMIWYKKEERHVRVRVDVVSLHMDLL